jgi:hypothetical protein
MNARGLAWLLVALVATGCAARDAPREPAPPAITHGWVDFNLLDRDVPADPFAQLADGSVRPPACELVVALDGREVHTQRLAPTGAAPPYRVESDFRLAVPPGSYGAAVTYTGCRSHARGLDSVEAELRIAVRRQQVTRVRFDGTRLEADYPAGERVEPSAR